ncbi:MAG: hypothetical protein E7Z92_05335 [Cyanobacteria bacterium SIG31]|nr:hypothetical protein [Cyanobacteria bacterium SIG31]
MSNPLSTKTSFSSSNYYDFGNEINKSNFESLNTFNLSLQSGDFTATVGIGASTKFNIHSPQKGVTTVPAVEAKLKYNISNHLNAQARIRKIDDTEQYRVTFGGSYSFDKNNSIYSSAHLTTKHSKKGWKTNTGAWVGYTHNFNNCSLSAELQQNIPFKGKIQPSDTMVNVIVSVPF